MKALFLDADDEEYNGFQQPLNKLTIDPNLDRLLSELSNREIPLWIVSKNDPGTIEKAVEYLGLADRIPLHRISCNWRDKGERIKEIMSENQIEKALFVGDRGSDYEAGLAAGIEGRIVKRRFNQK